MGAMDGEGILRGIGKKFFFDYFTSSEYIGERVLFFFNMHLNTLAFDFATFTKSLVNLLSVHQARF